MRYVKLITAGWAAFILTVFPCGCSDEIKDPGGEGTGTGNEKINVVITLGIPEEEATGTRTLKPEQEGAVNRLDVFVFDKNLKLTDWKYGEPQDDTQGVSFTVSLQAGKGNDDKFRIMALANMRHITYNLFGGENLGGYAGRLYNEVRAALYEAVPAYANLEARGMPMWGEIEEPVLINGENKTLNMDMLRSLARVDVGVNSKPSYSESGKILEWSALPGFSLEKVYVYNASLTYSPTPDRAAYSFTDKKVSALTLPVPNAKDDAPAEYSDEKMSGTVDRDKEKGVSITGTIYTGEADVRMEGVYADLHHAKRMALVVAGYYSPDPAKPNTTVLSYYRLDLVESSEAKTLMDVLRNRNYQVVIKAVNGAGYPSKEEAFKKFNTDIEAAVLSWVPANQGATVIDGQNFLSVAKHGFMLDKWAVADTRTEISTNQAKWTATIANPADKWIQLRDIKTGKVVASVTGVSKDKLRFSIDAIPPKTAQREAKIRITAGAMTLHIVVKQTEKDQEFMLRLSHSEMNFTGRKWNAATTSWVKPDPQKLEITYGPSLHKYSMKLVSYLGGGVAGIKLPNPPQADLAEMPIQLDAIAADGGDVKADPFFQRSSRLEITAKNVDGSKSITKTVMVKQTFYSALVTGKFDYYMQGQKYVLKIRSNSAWKAQYSGDKTIFSQYADATGQGVTSAAGESLSFTINSKAVSGKEAYITISSPTNLFPAERIVISAQDALPNSYIVAPGKYVDIPVRKAYRVWKLDRDLKKDLTQIKGARTVELLWQDKWDGKQGIIKSVGALTGKEQDAVFRVTANTLKPGGNAVVAFKIAGVTYWSWHIWVTDYNPEKTNIKHNTFTMMDRNLGAMNNKQPANDGDISSFGLFYEGGRKDPWVGMSGFKAPNNTKPKPMYNSAGKAVAVNATTPSPPGVNLAGAINNPTTYYIGTYGSTSWYGAFLTMRQDFWITNGRKGDFNPCPKGWTIPDRAFFDKPGTIKDVTRGVLLAGSFFPAEGRFGYVYDHYGFGAGALYWSTVVNGHDLVFAVSSKLTEAVSGSWRSTYGAPMRCVKE